MKLLAVTAALSLALATAAFAQTGTADNTGTTSSAGDVTSGSATGKWNNASTTGTMHGKGHWKRNRSGDRGTSMGLTRGERGHGENDTRHRGKHLNP